MNTKDILDSLPSNIRTNLELLNIMDKLQEIRIKVNKPIIYVLDKREIISSLVCLQEDMKVIMQKISNYSLYAHEEDMKQGYITINGGHRVGICGKCVLDEKGVKTIRSIASINIRVSRAVLGCSNNLMKYLVKDNRVLNTIIISPPKCGKTTLLRDISRNISDGFNLANLSGKKVCVIDERSEIAACYEGIPQMNVGLRTDVLDNCIKSSGIMMAIRSMSPDVVICDEIGTEKDMESILAARTCGISVISTIHGFDIEDLKERFIFKDIIKNNIFDRAIILNSKNGVGKVLRVYDFKTNEDVMEGML